VAFSSSFMASLEELQRFCKESGCGELNVAVLFPELFDGLKTKMSFRQKRSFTAFLGSSIKPTSKSLQSQTIRTDLGNRVPLALKRHYSIIANKISRRWRFCSRLIA